MLAPLASRGSHMSLALSSADRARLEAALAVAASPLAYESVATWRETTRAAVQALVGAFDTLSYLPMAGEPLLHGSAYGYEIFVRSQPYFGGQDPGIAKWRRERYAVATMSQAYPPDGPGLSAWYRVVPRRRAAARQRVRALSECRGRGREPGLAHQHPVAVAAGARRAPDRAGGAAARAAQSRLPRRRGALPARRGPAARAGPPRRRPDRRRGALRGRRGPRAHEPALERLLAADPEGARLNMEVARTAAGVGAAPPPRGHPDPAKSPHPPPPPRTPHGRTAHPRYRV